MVLTSIFPEVYPEGYCGYVVDNDTNTITVILLDTSKSKIARYSELIPDKYQKYLRFDEGKHSLNELSKAFYEIQTLLADEGISFGWNFDGNVSLVKVSVFTDKNCSLTTTEEVEKRVKDLLEQTHFAVQYEYDVHLDE